jgi:hypothetical protein
MLISSPSIRQSYKINSVLEEGQWFPYGPFQVVRSILRVFRILSHRPLSIMLSAHHFQVPGSFRALSFNRKFTRSERGLIVAVLVAPGA